MSWQLSRVGVASVNWVQKADQTEVYGQWLAQYFSAVNKFKKFGGFSAAAAKISVDPNSLLAGNSCLSIRMPETVKIGVAVGLCCPGLCDQAHNTYKHEFIHYDVSRTVRL